MFTVLSEIRMMNSKLRMTILIILVLDFLVALQALAPLILAKPQHELENEIAHSGNIKELVSKRKNLDYVKQLVEDMDNQLNRLQKRTCFVNAGLSDLCDYKEISSAVKEQNLFNSKHIPGKRGVGDIVRFLRSMKLAAAHKRR